MQDWATYLETINKNPFSQSNLNTPQSPQPIVANQNISLSSTLQANNPPGVFKQAEPVLEGYQITLSKELCIKLHVQQLRAQLKYRFYPNWSVSYKPPVTLINDEEKVKTLVDIREKLARIMLETNLKFYEQLLVEMEETNASTVESLEAMYKTGGAKEYSLKQALEKCRTYAEDQREKKLGELTKIMEAIRQAPLAALWQGIPEQFQRPTGATRVPPPNPNPAPAVAGPSFQQKKGKNKNNKSKNWNNRSRPQNRPAVQPPRNRSTSAAPTMSKKRKDEISKYVAKAVETTVIGLVKDFM